MSFTIETNSTKFGTGKSIGLKTNICVTNTIRQPETLAFISQQYYSGSFFDNSKMTLKNSNRQTSYVNMGNKATKRKPFLRDKKLSCIKINFTTCENPTPEYSVPLAVTSDNHEIFQMHNEPINEHYSLLRQAENTPVLNPETTQTEPPKEKESLPLHLGGFDEGKLGLQYLQQNSAYINMRFKKLSYQG